MGKPLKRATVIVIVEISMLLGVVLSLFMVPGSTPLRTFLIIGGAIILLFNVLLFWSIKRKREPSTSERRRGTAYVFWILLALCLLMKVLFWKLGSR